MTKSYKGYTLEVYRDKCLGGWDQLYFSIMRDSDGFECVSNFEESNEKVNDKMKQLKHRVDGEEKEVDPWGEQKEIDDILYRSS